MLALINACPDLIAINLQHCAKIAPDDLRRMQEHPRKLRLSLGLPAQKGAPATAAAAVQEMEEI